MFFSFSPQIALKLSWDVLDMFQYCLKDVPDKSSSYATTAWYILSIALRFEQRYVIFLFFSQIALKLS